MLRYKNDPDAVKHSDFGVEVAEKYKEDVERHLWGRFDEFLGRQLPWLNKHRPIDGSRILEIGCGTGSSTAALGLMGAKVDAIDIADTDLAVARRRCELFKLQGISLYLCNGTEIDRLHQTYDVILFFATLEHMTHDERVVSLSKAWHLLNPKGFLGVIECPNRLWFYDPHTTFENFYNWLPDRVAMDYAHYYKRDGFRSAFIDLDRSDKAAEKLARWGRGASYHEIEIAIGPVRNLDVKEGVMDYRRANEPDLERWWQHSVDGQYYRMLKTLQPKLQNAFCYPWFEILIQKPDRKDAKTVFSPSKLQPFWSR